MNFSRIINWFKDKRVFKLISIKNGYGTCDIVYTIDGVEHKTRGDAFGFRGVYTTTSNAEWRHLIHWWEKHREVSFFSTRQ